MASGSGLGHALHRQQQVWGDGEPGTPLGYHKGAEQGRGAGAGMDSTAPVGSKYIPDVGICEDMFLGVVYYALF